MIIKKLLEHNIRGGKGLCSLPNYIPIGTVFHVGDKSFLVCNLCGYRGQ